MRRLLLHAAVVLAAVVLAAIVLAACDSTGTAASAPPSAAPASAGAVAANATILNVVDGDTVIVRAGGTQETVRLIGIDTPEVKDPDEPVQCFGPEASSRTKALLPKGTAVRLERDEEPRDVYGRLLAYVYRAGDGLFVNLDLATGGYADTLSIPPNVAHAAELRAAVDAARRARRGLWGACEGFGVPAG